MDILIAKYDKVLSLGYSCFPKLSLMAVGQSCETQLFDYTGTAMWSINNLINNDYEGLTDINNFKNMRIYTDNDKPLAVNEKYYIRFPHDLQDADTNKHYCDVKTYQQQLRSGSTMFNKIQKTLFTKKITESLSKVDKIKSEIENVIQKYERRIDRFKEILSSNNKIVFLRYEEPMVKRFIHNQYLENYKKSEYYYVVEFSKIMKRLYPELDFIIVFFKCMKSESERRYDADNNIIILEKKVLTNTQLDLSMALENNRDFLESILH